MATLLRGAPINNSETIIAIEPIIAGQPTIELRAFAFNKADVEVTVCGRTARFKAIELLKHLAALTDCYVVPREIGIVVPQKYNPHAS